MIFSNRTHLGFCFRLLLLSFPSFSVKMRRNDDRYGTRLYVGRLSSRTRSRDLENRFSRYGRVRDVELKHDFAFIEFSDPRDADDARHSLNGREFDGSRIIVEFAKGGPRGSGGHQEYLGRGPPPGSGRCFNCGIDGHWARDCKAGDWKNKCYRCGERGHIERNCQNSPQNLKHGRSYSRSRSRSPVRRGRSRSRSYSKGRSYSPSRSPPRREKITGRERSRSPQYSRSPKLKKISPSKRTHSPSPVEGSPMERGSPHGERRQAAQRDGSDYSVSPRGNGRSPVTEKESPDGRYRSPETNGRSPSPRDNRSPVEDDEDNRVSPRRSRSLSGSQ